jgi:hypothetical protein
MAEQSFNVQYDPFWHEPLSIVRDGAEVTRISITEETTLIFTITTQDVTFTEGGVQFFLDQNLTSDVTVNPDRTTLSFQVQPLPSSLAPVIFSLVATVPAPMGGGSIAGVRTAQIFVTLPDLSLPSEVKLIYNTETGDFLFSGLAEGQNLKPGQLIVLMASGQMDVSLVDQNDQSLQGLMFAGTPITWLSPRPPDWINVTFPGLMKDKIRITNQFHPGDARPFNFVIHHNGLEFRSPDPIIINVTIGDG